MVRTSSTLGPLLGPQVRHGIGMWCEGWAWPYESAFGLLQKFSWVNCLSVPRLSKLIFGADPARHGGSSELLVGGWIRRNRLRVPESFPILEGFLSHNSRTWSRYLGTERAIRFCPSCLSVGFHSIFHQIDGLTHCPVHKERLTDQCMHCNEASGPLVTQRTVLKRPFECIHCGGGLNSTFDPTLWLATTEQHAVIRKHLSPIVKWLADLESRYPAPKDLPVPLEQLNYLYASGWDSNATMMFDLARQLVAIRIPDTALHISARPVRYLRVWDHGLSNDMYTPVERLRTRSTIFKAIRRHLVRTYLQRHRYCLSHATQTVRVERVQGELVVVPDITTCPVAGALRHWVIKNAPNSREQWNHAETLLNGMRHAISSSDSLWANIVLSDFYSCCASQLVRMAAFHIEANFQAIPGRVKAALFAFSILGTRKESSFACSVPESSKTSQQHIIVSGSAQLVAMLERYYCPTALTTRKRFARPWKEPADSESSIGRFLLSVGIALRHTPTP